MARKHSTCEICWQAEVDTQGIDRCARCKDEWRRIVRAYDELCMAYPTLRRLSVAAVVERLAKRAIAIRARS